MKWCERHRQEITFTDSCPLGEMAGQECQEMLLLSRTEWEATIRDKARIVLVSAMVFGNDNAAYNSGSPVSYYEDEADYYLDEMFPAAVGKGNDE